MEDLERRNVMQYMLLVYLDERRWAKVPEEMKDERARVEDARTRCRARNRLGRGPVEFSLARTSID